MIVNEVEIWRLNETRKGTDAGHGRLFKRLSELPKFSASGVAEIELGRDNRKGKFMESEKTIGNLMRMWILKILCDNILNGRKAIRKLKRR